MSALIRGARYVSVLFGGVFAGFLVAVLVLELSLRGYDGQVYAQVRQVELDSLDKLAGATLIPALIATALLAVAAFRAREGGRWPVVSALALLALVFVLTMVVNLPINSDQAGWNVQAPPPGWVDDRDRWQIAHAVRTVAAVAAFGFLILGRRSQAAPASGRSARTLP
ncbi:anthrone oxygenase family protein [Spirillospora sp. NPDC048911]|uniref:anthrone oxygenase family protein n=1 Tax=Spirillospora sp. NPDC048911 TaxID=3364527 RepID=UPI0037191E6E